MNRFSGQRRTTSSLSESVQQRLNLYALSAGAAGVSMLALAQPAEAKIVYTPTHVNISSSYNLDLNHDGIIDFTIRQNARSSHYCRFFRLFRGDWLTEAPMQGNATVVDPTNPPKPTALHRGAEVGPRQNFGASSGFMALVYSGYDVRKRCMHVRGMADDWVNVSNRYLGLKFIIHGKLHYGWARLSVQVGYLFIKATLTGYAYETIPGKPIKAGQTKNAADDPATDRDFMDPDDPGPEASLTSPLPDILQPASLGMLALGATAPRTSRLVRRPSPFEFRVGGLQ